MRTFHEILIETIEEEKKKLEIVQEATIDTKHKSGYNLAVNPQSGGRYSTMPYFKFFKGDDPTHVKKVARIELPRDKKKLEYDSLKYLNHPRGKGEHFNLKSKEFDILDSILKMPSTKKLFVESHPDATIWDEVIWRANEAIMNDPQSTSADLIPENVPIPDYRNILKPI